jgi:hypothetical protein
MRAEVNVWRTMTQATLTREHTDQVETPVAAEEYICPISGTTTCTATEAEQRTCSAC